MTRCSPIMLLSGIIALCGGLVIFGWWLDISSLKSVFSELATMKFNTALCFLFSGIVLGLQTREKILYPLRWVLNGSLLLLSLVAVLSLLEYLTWRNFGLDELFVSDFATDPEIAPPGRMSAATAVCFLIAASSFITIRWRPVVAQLLALLLSALGIIGITGYLFGAESLYSFFPYSTMALHTAILFFLLGQGILWLRPEEGLAKVVSSGFVGGYLSRRLLPVAVILPIVAGWLRLKGEYAGIYETEVGTDLFVVASIIILITIIWYATGFLNRLHSDLIASNKKLSRVNNDLERRNAALDAHSIVAVTDSRGKIIFVNDKFCAISKFSREELIGQDHRIINSGYHEKEFFKVLWETIKSGQVWDGEVCNRAKDGSRYWVATTIFPFVDANGIPEQYIALRTDITETKRNEERLQEFSNDLRDNNEELERSNKELDQFAYIASHDLKSPLRAIKNLTNWIKVDDQPNLSEDSRHHIELLLNRITRMEGLLDSLLEYSRAGKAEHGLKSVDLKQMIESTIQFLDVPDGFSVSITGQCGSFSAPRIPLELVIRNLINNAVKHHDREDGRIEIQIRELKDTVEVAVSDDGPGIPQQYHARIFEMFQTLKTKDEVEGSGMGLTLIKKILDTYRGSIKVESEGQKGAKFIFNWPKK